ncbi:MAG: hypothetical protein JO288_13070, partial [Hyphomicrobiales bacterium]|nr:hypothetical protein [Hyphomicrobiales bacterium]
MSGANEHLWGVRAPRIFDLISQVEAGGAAGLACGLAPSKRLVELRGGAIEAVRAGAGKGREFIARAPLAAASAV